MSGIAGAGGSVLERDRAVDDDHPTRWFREMSTRERRTFWACFLGWVTDAMDVQFLAVALPAIIAAFGLSNTQAGLIGSATLVSSAVGGWTAGALADRIGRVRVLQLTIATFSVATFLIGFAGSYWQVLTFRTLMGLGFGGEWAVAAIMVAEVISPRHRGKAVGTMQSGWAVGYGLAVVISTICFTLVPEAYAWRLLFWLGVLPGVLVLFVRRYVEEPEIAAASRREAGAGSGSGSGSFLRIFAPPLLGTTLLASLFTFGAQGGSYAFLTWLPTYLRTERHLSVLGSGGYLGLYIVASFAGFLLGAWLTDRIGRRPTFVVFAGLSFVSVILFTLAPLPDALVSLMSIPVGLFGSACFSGMGTFLSELYPTAVRGSGQGFCYNFGRAAGGVVPALVGWLSAHFSLGVALGLFAAAAYGLMIAAALLLPETRGRRLEAIPH